MNFTSKFLEQAVDAFSTLPGIGRKSALRLALYMIDQPEEVAKKFAEDIFGMRIGIQHCQQCNNLSDGPICGICEDPKRESHVLCVVENARDVMAIENTYQFKGRYHVLGGIISPLDGVGPENLSIDLLLSRLSDGVIAEVVFAISPTLEGETTVFFIAKKMDQTKIKVTSIARGVSFGGELEYADELTLGRSILGRTPYNLPG
jgi:recombination protein RecR